MIKAVIYSKNNRGTFFEKSVAKDRKRYHRSFMAKRMITWVNQFHYVLNINTHHKSTRFVYPYLFTTRIFLLNFEIFLGVSRVT